MVRYKQITSGPIEKLNITNDIIIVRYALVPESRFLLVASIVRRALIYLKIPKDKRYRLKIRVVPGECLLGRSNEVLWGLFGVTQAGKSSNIYIPQSSRSMRNETQWKLTLLHELAHYEQWVNGKALVEYGVQNRAKGLWNKIKKS